MRNLKPNIQYICTKPSSYETFMQGDRVIIHDDGLVVNKSASGFIIPEEIGDSFEGAEFEPDYQWIERTRSDLQKALAKLGEIE